MSQSWKLIVYIAADNSLYENALVSLRQIAESSLSAGVEILVQLDGPTDELASRYRCAGGQRKLYWQAPSQYTLDRGKRLKDFLLDSVDSSEGKRRIFLVLWGHGAGLDHVYVYKQAPSPATASAIIPEKGNQGNAANGDSTPIQASPLTAGQAPVLRPFDLLNSNDANRNVTDIDLGRILLEFKTERGQKIDLLGLDACLMGMAEICHELRNSVSLMVASDEELPGNSWPYDLILGDLTKFYGMDPSTLSTVVISRFLERYTAVSNPARISLSAYDLSACDEFAAKFKALVDAISTDLNEGTTKSKIVRARDFSRTPDEAAYIDLVVFCEELTKSFSADSAIYQHAAGVLKVIIGAPYVMYHRDFGEDGAIDSYGLALYFPESLDSEENTVIQPPAEPARTGEPDTKFPPNTGKFPPNTGKTSSNTTGESQPITSYRILWSHYVALEFNKTTGWSDLVARFLSWTPELPAAPSSPALTSFQRS